jgi:hypothetical protein
MRRLHRSRLFWLGLPGVVFLAWAWNGSLRAPTSGKLYSKPICAGFINRAGTITLAYTYPGDPFMEGTSFDLHVLPAPPSATKLPPALEKTKLHVLGDWGPDVPPPPQMTFAYWFLLLGYLVPWSAAIYWRQNRKKKAIPA